MTAEERTDKLKKVIRHLNAEENLLIRARAAEDDAKTSRLRRLIDPIEIVIDARARCAELKYPTPERERAAAGNMASYSKMIDELIRNGADLNTLRSNVFEMEEACRRLSIPEKAPSFRDEMERTHAIFRQASWFPAEVHGLESFFRSGDRINAIKVSSVTLGDREISRADVRKKITGLVTNAQIAEFEKREQEAVQLERDNDDRRARGAGTHHRQW